MFDVLHVISSIDPRHGGPSRTVPAIAAAQAALGAKVALATLSSAAAPPPLGACSLLARDPSPWGGQALAFSPALAATLLATPARVIHAHGLWQRPLHYAARAAARHRAPLVLAPRGMLEPWALGHHTWKKRLSAALVHPGAVASVAGWHATAAQEAGHLRALPAWLRAPAAAPACVAPNGIAAPDPAAAAPARAAWLSAYPQLRDKRVALFYGRFHRKKRVAELIELWRSAPRPGWTLLLAGLPGDYTVAELSALAASSPTSPIVVADGSALPQPYALADLFLLPSHSENFGQAVAEALAAGVPALVTDTLPWRELDAVRAGRSVPWTDYPAALAALLASPGLPDLGAAARAWVLANFTWESSARRLLDFYPTLRPAAAP